jgi:hypothetical protein
MSCNTKCAEQSNDKICFDKIGGRQFTDYSTTCNAARDFRSKHNFSSGYEERMYMIRNADKLMMDNLRAIPSKICAPCVPPMGATGTRLPSKNKVICDKKKCSISEVEPTGLGF